MKRWIYGGVGCLTTTFLLHCVKPEFWSYCVIVSVINLFVWGRYGHHLLIAMLHDASGFDLQSTLEEAQRLKDSRDQ